MKQTALHTDGTAQVVRFITDPNPTGTTDTAYELWLKWTNLDIDQGKTLIEIYDTVDAFDGIYADGNVSYGDTWYVAGQPVFINEGDRSGTLLVKFTKTTLAGVSFEYEDRSITAYAHYKGQKMTSTLAIYTNSKTAPAFADGENFGVVKYRKNKFNRYDGHKRVDTLASGATGRRDWGTDEDWWFKEHTRDERYKDVIRVHYIRYFKENKMDDAADHIYKLWGMTTVLSAAPTSQLEVAGVVTEASPLTYHHGPGANITRVSGGWKAHAVTDLYE